MEFGNITINVVKKDIKNIHLSVYPPDGRVHAAIPSRMDMEAIRLFLISKLGWIRKQQKKLQAQEREAPREFLARESHHYKGERYLLEVIERDAPPEINLKHSKILMYIRPGTDTEKKKKILDEWYRKQLKKTASVLIKKWEKKMKLQVRDFKVKKMRTKWGSCTREAGRIWINLELAKKPLECLEYIIVHEMAHLIERKHNDRFVGIMDKYMPKWKFYKEELNRLPVTHVEWGY